MNSSPSLRRKPIPTIRNPKKVTLELSSSSDEELPALNTKPNDNQDSIQLEDENESEYESYSYEFEEKNWKSNNSSLHKVRPPSNPNNRRHIIAQRSAGSIPQRGRRPTPKQKKTQRQEQETDFSQSQTKEISTQEESEISKSMQERDVQIDQSQDKEKENEEQQVQENNNMLNQVNNSTMESISLSEMEDTQSRSQPIFANTAQINDHQSITSQIYQIFYQSFNMRRRQVSMLFDEDLVYYSQPVKNKEYGNVNIICRKKTTDINSPDYEGMIIRNRKSSRFLLIGKSDGTNPPPQIVGISFLNQESSNFRYFRIAIPLVERPYIKNDKASDLSQIAKRGDENVEGVKILHTALPIRNSDGKFILRFYSPFPCRKSAKNFLIRNEDDSDTLFLFCQVNYGFCKLIRNDPITPLISFALSVAILTTKR